MFPAATAGGGALVELGQRRLDELQPGELVFPAARGGWVRVGGGASTSASACNGYPLDAPQAGG